MFQLQIFTGKVYTPDADGGADELIDLARRRGLRRWRVVLLDKARAIGPFRLSKPRSGTAYARSIYEQKEAYLKWARGRGLPSVALYAGDKAAGLSLDGFAVRRVDPSDTFGPAIDENQELPVAA